MPPPRCSQSRSSNTCGGTGEGGVGVAGCHLEAGGEIVGEVGVGQHGARRQRARQVADRRQHVVVDVDDGGGVLGIVAAVGHHDGHGLAGVADLVDGEACCVRRAVIEAFGTSIGMRIVAAGPGMSLAVSTATTPGMASAALGSMP